MARISVETAKSVIVSLLSEHERDRESLQRLIDHSDKMIAHLQVMRDDEENRIESDASERKQNVRRMFAQLVSVEEERRERLQIHIADIDGQKLMVENATAVSTPQAQQQRINSALAKKA
jgi:hypothetical protein